MLSFQGIILKKVKIIKYEWYEKIWKDYKKTLHFLLLVVVVGGGWLVVFV